jgi:motility quorum-sensing regulator/GCU-specific mRNA interferase toxin
VEKRTPHCKLAVVKTMLAAGKVPTTVSALAGGAALGFGFEEIIGVVAALRSRTPAGEVYLKLTALDDVLIVSFKEL